MLKNKVFITSAVRTAIGSLGKSLKNINADDLGSAVILSAILQGAHGKHLLHIDKV